MSNLDDLDLKSEQSANSSSVYEHYRQLISTLNRYAHAYYVEDNPILSLTASMTAATTSSKISKPHTVLRILMPQPVVLAMLS